MGVIGVRRCTDTFVRMNKILSVGTMAVLLLACTDTRSPESDPEVTTATSDTAVAAVAIQPGYYTGTLPLTDGPSQETSLWLRSDSTFVLQRKRLGVDSVPYGRVGRWHVSGGNLELADRMQVIQQLSWSANGLEWLNEDGQPIHAGHPLAKLADEVGDAIPRMRLTGTFTYLADAQSFKPCGSTYTWPCVGGMDLSEVDGEPLVPFTNIDLQRAYAKAVKQGGDPWEVEVICTLSMGPAMEGDGADEYLYVEEVIGTAEGTCP